VQIVKNDGTHQQRATLQQTRWRCPTIMIRLGLLLKGGADDIAPLQVLSSIKAKSDGYVAEYFNEIGVALFYKDFRDLFVFIHDQPLESKDGIRKALIEGLSLEVADADDSKAKRKQINSFAKKQIEKHQLDSSEIETVRQVLAEINETTFH
jgi:hypothetical protein